MLHSLCRPPVLGTPLRFPKHATPRPPPPRLQVSTLPGMGWLGRLRDARKEGRTGEATINSASHTLALGFAVYAVGGAGPCERVCVCASVAACICCVYVLFVCVCVCVCVRVYMSLCA